MGHLVTLLSPKKIIVQDVFNRADNASSLGTANTGQAYQIFGPSTFGINSNQAYVSTLVAGGNFAVIDTPISDASLQITSAIFAANNRLVFRYTDVDNHFLIQSESPKYALYRAVAGAYTEIGNFATTPANGDVIKIVAAGSSIKVFINGVQRINVTNTFNQTAKMHGIGIQSTTGRLDNFLVEAI